MRAVALVLVAVAGFVVAVDWLATQVVAELRAADDAMGELL